MLAGMLAGIGCAVLGVYVVWRGMAFVGDAIAHTILPGIVVAFMLGINAFIGALAAAVITALGIGLLSRRSRLKEDTAIGVVFSGLFALGILLLSKTGSYQDLTHILFGNILGVSWGDFWGVTIVIFIVMAFVLVFYKELLVTSFDPGHALAIGLSPELIRYGLLLLIALTVVTAIQTVGVVLVIALLVTPAATASLLARELPHIMLLGIVFSILSTIAGLYISFYVNVSSGASVVLALTAIFILVFLLAPGRGVLWKLVSRT
nr:metal ABC transporter permease [Anaerolineae bacterium]